MLDIVLYGRVNDRKKVEKVLIKYFNKVKIQFKIYSTPSSLEFMTDYLNDNRFHVFIACMDGSTTYMIKTHIYEMDNSLIIGYMSFPPTEDEINKNLLRNYEFSNISAHGEYAVKGKNTVDTILHNDIEYIKREEKKSIFHLKDGSKVYSDDELSKVELELGKEYFVRCGNKCVVNTLNIYKIYSLQGYPNKIEFVSGAKIPISRSYANIFLQSYSHLMPESVGLKSFDV